MFSTLRNADLVRPTDESLCVYVSALREDMSSGRIRRLYWINTKEMLADGLTKGTIPRDGLLEASAGNWTVEGRSECVIGHKTWDAPTSEAQPAGGKQAGAPALLNSRRGCS